ncbi:hypothetical protein UM538_02305 [Staphylococcus aureus]|nr:hypothetical protein UM538_02305 [Staphylococcus aureus]
MANNHNQNGQDSTQQVINFLKVFKWRIVGFLAFSINRDIILNVRFLENNTYHRFMFNWCGYWVYKRP